MLYRIFGLLGVLTVGAFGWHSYNPRPRPDFANISFKVQSHAVAGLRNSAGTYIIAPGGDVLAAVTAAANAWTAPNVPSSAVRFAPITYANADTAVQDGINLLVLEDTPAVRAALGCNASLSCNAAGMTLCFSAECDILIAPDTTLVGATDPAGSGLAQVLRHEFGHFLGSSHSGIYSATMWPSNSSSINSDDIAFVSTLYPAAGSPGRSQIQGKLFYSNGGGSPRYGLVTASSNTGIVVGGMVDANGDYTISGLPEGVYIVTAQPIGYYVLGSAFGISGTADMFKVGCHGGCIEPRPVSTKTQTPTTGVNINVASGPPSFRISTLGVTAQPGATSYLTSSFAAPRIVQGSKPDLLVFMRNIGSSVLPEYFTVNWFLRGIKLPLNAPATLDTTVVRSGVTTYRRPFVVSSPPSGWSTVIAIDPRTGEAFVAEGYMRTIDPGKRAAEESVRNGASLQAGRLAPDSVATIIGSDLASDSPATDVTATITDSEMRSHPATVLYASPAQVNLILPPGMAKGPGIITVSRPGADDQVFATEVDTVAPGLFSANQDGQGPALGYVTIRRTGVEVGTESSEEEVPLFSADAPVGWRTAVPVDVTAPGTQLFLNLYATGVRSASLSTMTATVGAVAVPVAGIDAQPTPGIEVIRIGPLPRSQAGRGAVDVVVRVGSAASQPVTIALK